MDNRMDLTRTPINKFDMFKKSILTQAMKLGSCVVVLLFFAVWQTTTKSDVLTQQLIFLPILRLAGVGP